MLNRLANFANLSKTNHLEQEQPAQQAQEEKLTLLVYGTPIKLSLAPVRDNNDTLIDHALAPFNSGPARQPTENGKNPEDWKFSVYCYEASSQAGGYQNLQVTVCVDPKQPDTIVRCRVKRTDQFNAQELVANFSKPPHPQEELPHPQQLRGKHERENSLSKLFPTISLEDAPSSSKVKEHKYVYDEQRGLLEIEGAVDPKTKKFTWKILAEGTGRDRIVLLGDKPYVVDEKLIADSVEDAWEKKQSTLAWNRMPPELLREIASYLAADGDIDTLESLSLVDKRTCEAVNWYRAMTKASYLHTLPEEERSENFDELLWHFDPRDPERRIIRPETSQDGNEQTGNEQTVQSNPYKFRSLLQFTDQQRAEGLMALAKNAGLGLDDDGDTHNPHGTYQRLVRLSLVCSAMPQQYHGQIVEALVSDHEYSGIQNADCFDYVFRFANALLLSRPNERHKAMLGMAGHIHETWDVQTYRNFIEEFRDAPHLSTTQRAEGLAAVAKNLARIDEWDHPALSELDTLVQEIIRAMQAENLPQEDEAIVLKGLAEMLGNARDDIALFDLLLRRARNLRPELMVDVLSTIAEKVGGEDVGDALLDHAVNALIDVAGNLTDKRLKTKLLNSAFNAIPA